MLPSGYIDCTGVRGVYDTGVYTSNTLEIDGLFSSVTLQNGWVFGARNTNSTSSAGQLCLQIAATSYYGYASARISMTTGPSGQKGFIHIRVDGNYFEFSTQRQIWSATGATTTFTGTRTIYIGGMNNAGSVNAGPSGMVNHGMIIKQNGTLLADIVPAYDVANSKQGMYDYVSETFLNAVSSQSYTLYKVEFGSSTGGQGFAKNTRGELVGEIMAGSNVSYPHDTVTCIAVPDDGYVFKNWTNQNNTVLSTSQVYEYSATGDTVLTPHFEKVTAEMLNTGYYARIYAYDGYDGIAAHVKVLSASISEDALQKSSSTFIVEDVPSSVRQGELLRLYSPRGEWIYTGFIESVEGKELTCREPLSLFDQDYLFKSSTFDQTNYTAQYGVRWLMENSRYSRNFDPNNLDDLLYLRMRILDTVTIVDYDKMSIYNELNSHVLFPAFTETKASNLEELLFECCGFGIFIEAKEQLTLDPYYYRTRDKLTFGDNLENISNIEVTEESQVDTILIVFNSTGATLRGMYGTTNSGVIKQYNIASADETEFMGYTNYIGKVVLSDDNINTVLAQNLTNSALNHKITFDIVFNDMLTMSKLKIGTPVDFYVGNRLYQSVITAVSYDIVQNVETIANARITLGNVRTSLTSKLNLGR